MKAIRALVLVLSATVLSVGCVLISEPERVIEQTYDVGKGDSLTVTTDVGSVDIESYSGSTLKLTARIRRTSLFFAPTDPEEVEIYVDTTNGITIWAMPSDLDGLSVSFDILVPESVSIERVRTGTGSVRLTDVAASGSVQTTTGSIELRGVTGFPALESVTGSIDVVGGSGARSARTSTGSIEVELRGLPATSVVPLTVNTGSITVWIAGGLNVDIRGETDTGSISVDGNLDFSGIEGSKLVDGRLGLGSGTSAPSIDAETNTGSIDFREL